MVSPPTQDLSILAEFSTRADRYLGVSGSLRAMPLTVRFLTWSCRESRASSEQTQPRTPPSRPCGSVGPEPFTDRAESPGWSGGGAPRAFSREAGPLLLPCALLWARLCLFLGCSGGLWLKEGACAALGGAPGGEALRSASAAAGLWFLFLFFLLSFFRRSLA